MTISEHLSELKRRAIYCCVFFILVFAGCYYHIDSIVAFLAKPIMLITNQLIYTSVEEPFFTYLNLAINLSFGLSFPFFSTQMYLFASSGLHRNEKTWIKSTIFFFILMFLFGCFVCYKFVIPQAVLFLVKHSQNPNINIVLQAKLSEYIKLIGSVIFGFGMAFQLPILLIILVKIKLITIDQLKKARRFAIVVIFIAAAILTPPDVLSQLILGLIMVALYESSILICRLIDKNSKT